MLRKQWAVGVLLIGAVALAGCGGAQPATPPPVVTNPIAITTVTPSVSPLPTPAVADSPLAAPRPRTLAELITVLQVAGATVEMGDRIEQAFFEVQGQALTVNGQLVEVFEWADEASREAISGMITPEGQLGQTMIEWTGTPHFWASGAMIVLYVGENSEVVNLLTEALGAPITR